MDIKIINIKGHGDSQKEYVLLKVLKDCNVGDYLIADDTYAASGTPSNKTRHVYFFPAKSVKEGEYVSLRTRVGTPEEGNVDSGEKVHRFYWGLKTAVWNDEGDCAHLLLAPKSQRQKFKVTKVVEKI